MNFEVYKISVLQDCMSLLEQGIEEKKDIKTILSEMGEFLTKQTYEEVSHNNIPPAENRLNNKSAAYKSSVKCSLCSQFARVLPVNDSPSTQVGGDYQSCAVCMSSECKNTDYYVETPQELIKKAK